MREHHIYFSSASSASEVVRFLIKNATPPLRRQRYINARIRTQPESPRRQRDLCTQSQNRTSVSPLVNQRQTSRDAARRQWWKCDRP